MKLYHNVTFSLLSVLFGNHCTRVYNIFKASVSILAAVLRCTIFWPEKEAVLQTLTKYRLPHGAWCTEIPLQKPKVSPAYCGRSSDTHITKESGLVDKWLPFIDSVMVDKGFFIDEPCSEHKVKLIWPPSLRKKEQLRKQDAKSNQNIAATQEHVESAIQRTKLFRILHDSFSRHQLSQIDDIVAIIADLVHPPKFPFKNGRYLST